MNGNKDLVQAGIYSLKTGIVSNFYDEDFYTFTNIIVIHKKFIRKIYTVGSL